MTCSFGFPQEGDKVLLIRTLSGGYAEYTVAEEAMVGKLPDRLSFSQGAGLGEPCYTAYRALCIK
ncbi:hypothetical protein DPMN_176667 [Dreissena polymorpha]|uniref:Uncharacterized protein n=1 Tax=Dreissena polymorpha TaxID=45954 RepID=A0A9D4IH44_DREPO|nr:hypothetical protein DPMN_176667 [Dreissena polymorpha]